jgi:hypothetical protein
MVQLLQRADRPQRGLPIAGNPRESEDAHARLGLLEIVVSWQLAPSD